MAAGSNTLLKLIATGLSVAAITVVVLAVRSRHHASDLMAADSGAPASITVAPLPMSREEHGKLSADGDTAKDTVATLVAEVKALKSEVGVLTNDNQKLRTENKDLGAMESSIQARIDARDSLREQQQTQRAQAADQQLSQQNSILASLQTKLNTLSGNRLGSSGAVANGAVGTDVPVGLGLRPGEGSDFASAEPVVWVNPMDMPPVTQQGKGSFPSPLHGNAASDSALTKAAGGVSDRVAQQLAADVPVYTINRDATLIGSIAMTALIGRVPIGGQVQDPYPFKVLVGSENLAANGILIPGLDAMVMSGVTTGDWALSCVRGEITSATFVFTDGVIRSYPKPDRSANNAAGGGSKTRKPFGYLSDKFGIPCVSGERKTNAVQYLATRVALAGAQAAAEAAAAAQTSTVVSGQSGAVTSAVTGSPSTFAQQKAIASGIQESSNWVKERQAQSFDAIFVRNGVDVAIHIDEEIPIDYEPAGRQVTHHAKLNFSGGEAPRRPLD